MAADRGTGAADGSTGAADGSTGAADGGTGADERGSSDVSESGADSDERGPDGEADSDATEPPIPPAFDAYATDELPNQTPRGPGKDGLLEATFARAGDGPTRLLRDRAEVPLHHTGTLNRDPFGPTLCVQEPTGGVAQGDRHRIAVEARAGAHCVVTTQAATKVHSMHSDYAHLDVALDVGPGAHAEYVPGATIVNEDARCLQTAEIDLANGASAILSDVLVSDGLTEHEPFGFDHYHSRVEARHDGDLVCADAVDLRPDERDPRDPASAGTFSVVGTLYVLAPDAAGDREEERGNPEPSDHEPSDGEERGASLDGTVEDLAESVHERLSTVETETNGGDERLRAGASTLPFEAGVGVRALGTRTDAVERALEAARDEARRTLFGVGVPGVERDGDDPDGAAGDRTDGTADDRRDDEDGGVDRC